MGEYAEMALSGLVCERCLEFLDGKEPGFPRWCKFCEEENNKYQKEQKNREGN